MLLAGADCYTLRTKYDSYYGRPIGQEFPNGEAVQVLYAPWGQPVAEKDPVSGTEYRRLNTVNGRGQPVQQQSRTRERWRMGMPRRPPAHAKDTIGRLPSGALTACPASRLC